MRRLATFVLLGGCASAPTADVLRTCGLAEGELRAGDELLAVPDAACGDALLADLGASAAERAAVPWADEGDGRVGLAIALWGLLAADFGALEPDEEAPASLVAELARLPVADGSPLGHALYAYVLARVDAVHPLTGDWLYRLDPDLRSLGYPRFGSSDAVGAPAIALVHAASHADSARTHLDCMEQEVVDEGPDPTWGGAQSITIWLTTRLYERAAQPDRAALAERLPLLVSGICDLDGVPDALWTRMDARPLTVSP
ncbi:MAG: hypothetical protein V4850_12165 [Myxococcota bacterium]